MLENDEQYKKMKNRLRCNRFLEMTLERESKSIGKAFNSEQVASVQSLKHLDSSKL